jgi:hypothetical protein
LKGECLGEGSGLLLVEGRVGEPIYGYAMTRRAGREGELKVAATRRPEG